MTTTAHIAFIAKQRMPLEFNTIVVREDGNLEQYLPGRPVEFRFAYGEVPFSARTRLAHNRTVLDLNGEVGPSPYSAESIPMRRSLHAILQASRSLRHCRLATRSNGSILATGTMALRTPLTPVAIISAATAMILELKPYLEFVSEIMPPRVKGTLAAGVQHATPSAG